MNKLVFLFCVSLNFQCLMFLRTNAEFGTKERDYALGEKITYNKDSKEFETTENFKGAVVKFGNVEFQKKQNLNEKTIFKKECIGDDEHFVSKFQSGNLRINQMYQEEDKLCVEYIQ